jgi:hypothetical protein
MEQLGERQHGFTRRSESLDGGAVEGFLEPGGDTRRRRLPLADGPNLGFVLAVRPQQDAPSAMLRPDKDCVVCPMALDAHHQPRPPPKGPRLVGSRHKCRRGAEPRRQQPVTPQGWWSSSTDAMTEDIQQMKDE